MAVQDDGIRPKGDRLMRGVRRRLAWLAGDVENAAERQPWLGSESYADFACRDSATQEIGQWKWAGHCPARQAVTTSIRR